MKNNLGKYALVFLTMGLLASCAKNLKPGDPIPGIPKKFSDLKVASSFNWITTKTLTIKINGYEGDFAMRETLVLSGKNIKGYFYRGNHLMNENLSVKVTIPTALDSMVVSFGTLTKTYAVEGNEMEVDYIINYPEITE